MSVQRLAFDARKGTRAAVPPASGAFLGGLERAPHLAWSSSKQGLQLGLQGGVDRCEKL